MKIFLKIKISSAFCLFLLVTFASYSQEKSYQIQLLNGSLLPKVNTQSFVSELSKQKEFSCKIIQFYDIPTSKERLELKKAGIELDDYIPNYAYIATFAKNRNLDVFNTIKVRAVFDLDNRFKLSHELYKKQYPNHILFGDEIKVLAIFLGDNGKAREKILKIGKILNYSLQEHNFEVQLPISKLEELLAIQEIKFIESINPLPVMEGTIFNTTGRTNWLNNSVTNLNIDGAGTTVAVEEGGIYDTNDNRIEIEGRLTEYGTGTISGHKRGVIYRMAGAGNLNPINEGIASGANVLSLNNNSSNNTYFSTVGLVSVNHSYGYGIGMSAWSAGTVRDQDIRDSIGPLHSWSAGNQSNNASTYGPYVGISGYANLTGGVKQAKNTFAVGSCNSFDTRVGFSSKGPAYDGRIKPDLMVEGVGGTSHAAPKISGVVGQLTHGYKSLNGGNTPHLSLIKTVLLNTCDDLENPGPDFRTGFGRVNVRRAYSVFQENRFFEASIANGGSNSHTITVPSNVKELRVLVHWADYPASTSIPVKALVNNLDMTLTNSVSTTFLPWVLNPAPHLDSLGKPAERGIDTLNNVEQITIPNPLAGNHTISINGTLIPQGPQRYHLTYEFLYNEITLTYPIGREHFVPGEVEYIQWDSYGSTGSFDLEYSVDSGASWITIATGINDTVRGYAWTIPTIISGNAMVKIKRGSRISNSIETFNIMPLVQNFSLLWRCNDSALLQWDNMTTAFSYKISKLGNKYMDSLTTTSNNFVLVKGLSSSESEWFSIQAYGSNNSISRRVNAIEIPITDSNCIGKDIALQTSMSSSHIPNCVYGGKFPVKIKLRNTGTAIIDSIIVKFQPNNGLIYADTIIGGLTFRNSLIYTFRDSITLSLGVDSIMVWLEQPGDVVSSNDSSLLVLVSYSCATVNLPYTQNFDSFTDCSTAWGCSDISCNLTDGWYNTTNTPSLVGDSIDWRTDHSGTATGFTGPSSDHTTGSGKYIYLETSTPCPRKEALVNSPCIDLTSSSFGTLKFWYHMYGSTIGSLNVDVLSNGEWINDISAPIVGNQGNLWIQKTVDLTPYTGQKIIIRFRGKTGNGYTGDIAIDDISVDRFPVVSFSTNDTIFCATQNAIFNNTTNNATSYKWSVSPNSYSYQNSTDSSSFQPEINFLSSGIFTIKLLATNFYGIDSLTKTTSIYIAPSSIPLYVEDTDTTYCMGDPIVIRTNQYPRSFYFFRNDSLMHSGVDTSYSYLQASDKDTIQIFNIINATCSIPSVPIIVTVKPNSRTTISVIACGSYSSPSGNYTWNTSNTYLDTIPNAIGCDSIITVNLTINNIPVGIIIVSGVTLTMGTTGVSYKWVNCDSNYSHNTKDTNQSFTPIINGNYACIMTSPKGCSDTTTCLTINSVGIDDFPEDVFEIKVYPNPAYGILNIEIFNLEVKEEITLSILDEMGRSVFFKKELFKEGKITIPVSFLVCGSYTLVMDSKSFSAREKIIIMR